MMTLEYPVQNDSVGRFKRRTALSLSTRVKFAPGTALAVYAPYLASYLLLQTILKHATGGRA